MKEGNHVYKAKLVRIVDADSIYFSLDVGFHTNIVVSTRLLGFDAPEVTGSEKLAGKQVTRLVESFFEKHKDEPLVVETRKTGSFGRWLADVYVGDIFLNDIIKKWSEEARIIFKLDPGI